MDLREYEQHKFALAALLRSATALTRSGTEEERQLRDLLARLAEDRFNLVVVGRFNRGKTSLMNAILGMDRLPTGIVPLTSVITTVSYGSREQVVLNYDRRILTKEVPIESLAQYITQHGNPGNVQGIRIAEVQLPAEILRRGFCFVDTPGLGSAIAENTRTTQAFLPEADAFILVTSYESPLSDEEMGFFRAASSAARRIFVAVNKQDMVSVQERQAALSYVHDQLGRVFGEGVPRLFSVSAREGLEAKLSSNASRLENSGLAAIEAELVSFLLFEKTTEFMLAMCDRAIGTMQALSAADDTKKLVDHVHDLMQRIRQGAGVTRLRTASIQPLPDATTGLEKLGPCEVCGEVIEVFWDFLRRYQYDLYVVRHEQQLFAARGGFCSIHAEQYEAIASPQGICGSYAPLLDQWATRLCTAGSTDADQEALFEKIRRFLPTRQSCPACQVRDRAEAQAISSLAHRLRADGTRVLGGISLCIPHLAMLSATIDDAALLRELVQRQARILQRLSEDMQRYSLKHEGVRRHLASDEEKSAAERGLAMVAGLHRANVVCLPPWRGSKPEAGVDQQDRRRE